MWGFPPCLPTGRTGLVGGGVTRGAVGHAGGRRRRISRMIRCTRSESAPGTSHLLDGPFTEAHCDSSCRCEATGHADGSLTEGGIYGWRVECTGWSSWLWWGKVRERAVGMRLWSGRLNRGPSGEAATYVSCGLIGATRMDRRDNARSRSACQSGGIAR